MILWRIAPVADPRDTWWQGRRIWREVIVRAPSAAMARRIARRLDVDPDEPPVGNESPYFRSGFADEKLYWVTRLDAADAAALGDGGVGEIVRAIPGAGPPLPEIPTETVEEIPAEPVDKAAE